METTNNELMARIRGIEEKVDILTSRMDQAMGAWFFVKLMASVTIGLTIVVNFAKEIFK